MTKRKRTPPTPPPRTSVVFEVPKSLWSFQAIARELARQSELLPQQKPDSQDQQSRGSERAAPGAPRFDAQTFQTNALRFSPYSHQPFLPSQPWPQSAKTTSAPHTTSNVKGSTAVTTSRQGGPAHEGHGQHSPGGPDDQLFDELNNALNADDDGGGMSDLDQQQQYVTGANRITFDPHFPGEWNGQSFIQSYPQIINPNPQPPFPTSGIAHHPPRSTNSNNTNIVPSSTTNVSPSFYHPKTPPPVPPHKDATQSMSNIPGYYKTSLKLWSQQEPHNSISNSSARQSAPQFESIPSNSSYPPLPSYSGNTAYPPPPPLASSPLTTFTTTYRGAR